MAGSVGLRSSCAPTFARAVDGLAAVFPRLSLFGAGLRRAKDEGKQLGRPRIAPELEKRILGALKAPGRTEGVRKIAARFGVNASTVQRIGRPFDGAGVAA